MQLRIRDSRDRAIVVSLAVSLLMLGGKLGAYILTGSTAILSDAMESVVHLLATGIAAFSLWYAAQPADREHPYGHGKMAYFSAGLEGTFIGLAALAIIYSAVRALIEGPQIRQLGVGVLVLVVLSVINLLLGWYLIRTGRKYRSLVLISNGHHVLTDVWTSVGVVVGVALVGLTGWVILDPLIAIVVGLNILWTAYRLVRKAFKGLMDTVDPRDHEHIRRVLDRAMEVGLIAGYHQLRHRRMDNHLWVEVHLLFPDDMSLQKAHERASRIEMAIRRMFPDEHVVVLTHLEPEHHEEAHPAGYEEPLDVLAPDRDTKKRDFPDFLPGDVHPGSGFFSEKTDSRNSSLT